MPIYSYKCAQCGANFDMIQRITDKPLDTHQDGCGGPVTKQMTAATPHFKGSGFYINDYKRKGK